MSAFDAVVALSAAFAGLALGAAFYASLRANVGLYLGQGSDAKAVAGVFVHVLRIALAVVVLVALARVSPVALVFGLAGFTIAGFVLGRRAREGHP